MLAALTPTATLEMEGQPEELDEENREEETDADVARRDVIQVSMLCFSAFVLCIEKYINIFDHFFFLNLSHLVL